MQFTREWLLIGLVTCLLIQVTVMMIWLPIRTADETAKRIADLAAWCVKAEVDNPGWHCPLPINPK